MTEPYGGRHAELYDLFYSDKPYEDEAGWVDRRLRAFDSRPQFVLDVASGTGEHSYALAELGYDMTGVDVSASMIARARSKNPPTQGSVDFYVQDMRSLDFPQASFDAAICLFDSIGYVRTDDSVERVFRSVGLVLVPGAPFIFEFWHAPMMVRSFDPIRVRRWEGPFGRVMRLSETSLDLDRNLAHVAYTVIELTPDGSTAVLEEKQVNRFFTIPEMESFVSSAGFDALEWRSGFSDKPADDETWHVVGVVRKR